MCSSYISELGNKRVLIVSIFPNSFIENLLVFKEKNFKLGSENLSGI